MISTTTALLLAATASAKMTDATWFYNREVPLLFSNGSGQHPQDSDAAIMDAFLYGANFVQVGLQMTSNGTLMSACSICLKGISNAGSTFTTPVNSFQSANESCTDDFLMPDFGFQQVRSLRINQSDANRNQEQNGMRQLFGVEGAIRNAKTIVANGVQSVNGNDPNVGYVFDIYSSSYYQDNYGLDIVGALMTLLEKYSIDTIENANASGIPVVITSWDAADLERLAGLTDLPLIQNVYFNNADYPFDLASISAYASGVKTEIGNLLWYPVTEKTDLTTFDAESYSTFVSEAHANNLSVFAYQLRDDQVQYTDSIEDEISMVVAKGVDGVFSDYTFSMYQALNILGNWSNWPPVADEDVSLSSAHYDPRQQMYKSTEM